MMAQTTSRWIPILAFLLLLPLSGILSSYYGNRELLLGVFLILGFAMLVFAVFKFENGAKSKDLFYSIAIFSISLTLLLSESLVSGNLEGWDIHQEYSLFLQVLSQGVWHPKLTLPYNSVLSVTIFPATLSLVTGFDGVTIFKIVFPLLYTMAPVLLYRLYRGILKPESSFLATFLFMAYEGFYVDMVGLARQEIAEVLLILLLYVLFSPNIRKEHLRTLLVFILTVGVVIAHYSIAYVYLFILLFSFLLSGLFRTAAFKLVGRWTLAVTVLVTVIWYGLLTSSLDLTDLVNFVLGINMADFFSLYARPQAVNLALSLSGESGLLHDLSRTTYYLVNFALVLGFLAFLVKKHKIDAERKMLPLMAGGMFLIGCAVVLPYFAAGIGLARLYHITLLFVAPCFVFGVNFLASKASQLFCVIRHSSIHIPAPRSARTGGILAAIVLLSFLLFDSGWVWAVTMDSPTSYLLDSQRMLTYPDPTIQGNAWSYYTSSQDIAAAFWLKPQLTSGTSLCSDYWTRNNVLTSYGGIPRKSDSVLTYYLPEECNFHEGYVYLSAFNTIYGVGTRFSETKEYSYTWPISEISPQLSNEDIVYSNGGSTIYVYPVNASCR